MSKKSAETARRMYIPSIGDQIRLTKNWSFPLYFEHRNIGLLGRIKPGVSYRYARTDTGSITATLEAGTVLRVARIYIRQGKSDWDSVTFTVSLAPNDGNREKYKKTGVHVYYSHQQETPSPMATEPMKFKGARFWAKLEDVNEIEFEPVDE